MGTRRPVALSAITVSLLLSTFLLFLPGVPPSALSASQPPQVKLSGSPQGAALDYSNRLLYIANNNGYVLVFNPATNAIVKNITTRGHLAYIAYENSTARLYATNSTGVVIIDGSTNTVAGTIRTGKEQPYGVTTGGGKVYVVASGIGKSALLVIDPQTEKIVSNITIPVSFASLAAYDSKDNRLYVADYFNATGYANMTSVIDLGTNSIIANIRVPNGPFAVAYGFGKVYVTEAVASTVAVIDPSTEKIVANLSTGYAPDGIAFSGDPLIAVSCYGNNGWGTTNFIDPYTDEPVGFINTPNGPQLVIYDHWLGEFFVVQYDGYLQGYIQALIQPPTTSTTTASTKSTSSTSTSSSTSSTTSTSSTGQPTTVATEVGTGGNTISLLDPEILVPVLFALLIAILALIGRLPWGKKPPDEGDGTEGTEVGTHEGTGGTEVGGTEGTQGSEEGTEGRGTEPPKPTNLCGPDVTKELMGVLKTVIEDYNKLGTWGKIKQALGMGFWTIDPLRDELSTIMPPDCGCPKSSRCEGTVMVFGKCFPAGIVNYTIYGVIEFLIGGRTVGTVLHGLYWVGKETVGNLTGLAPTSLHVGAYENFMVSVGWEFAQGGASAMEAQVQKIPGEPCEKCPKPPKPHRWKYTWFPEFPNEPSRY